MASETESSRSGRIVQRNSSNSGHNRTNNTTTHLCGALSAKRDEERVCPRRLTTFQNLSQEMRYNCSNLKVWMNFYYSNYSNPFSKKEDKSRIRPTQRVENVIGRQFVRRRGHVQLTTSGVFTLEKMNIEGVGRMVSVF
ncbi:hypothetical protein B9Z55_005222 [Caenorhabditis nigoni]|uniref:Uncharacterized protein n=1 Tax=Caenorhabditis nigoni TaxID=1611254 RepID=A0A2G5V005_9PELO|nr:hypothetical protein B9Z55_005222 [Caenorhabditis nigoni]